jgi:hypothetical protein
VAEGIEPNPGPTFEELEEKLQAKLKLNFDVWKDPLKKLRILVKAAFTGLSVSVEDTLKYLDDSQNRDEISKLGFGDQDIRVIHEAANELVQKGMQFFHNSSSKNAAFNQ